MMMGKHSDQFEEVLRRGRYLFHIHTNWTDGKNTLADYCVVAQKLGFKSVIIAEHIRRQCNYDFRAFLEAAERQRTNGRIDVIVGVEAKVVPGGFLDIPLWVLSKIKVLAIAEHSFEGDVYALARALMQVFKSLQNAEFARVWVHPGLKLLREYSAPKVVFQEVLHAALEYNEFIELNLRHRLPPELLLSRIPPSRVVIGLDAHSVEEVEVLAEEALRIEGALAGESEGS